MGKSFGRKVLRHYIMEVPEYNAKDLGFFFSKCLGITEGFRIWSSGVLWPESCIEWANTINNYVVVLILIVWISEWLTEWQWLIVFTFS